MEDAMTVGSEEKTTVAQALALALRGLGVSEIFGQSIPPELLLACERIGIRQVVYRTENAGGTMADGYARVSGRIGVVAAQNGPAATLLVPPLAEAMKASVPLLALVQEVRRDRRNRNGFQELDHVTLFEGSTKEAILLDDPQRLAADVEFALTAAVSGRPGPVVLLIPSDITGSPSEGPAVTIPARNEYPLDRPRPDAGLVKEAVDLLAAAENPIIVAGGGVHLSRASDALAELQDLASLPAGTTTMGKGALDERHPLSMGVLSTYMGRRSLNHGLLPMVQEADVILLVGTRTNENGTDSWRLYPESAKTIHLDLSPEEIGRNYDSVRLLGDARAGLQDLIDQFKATDLSKRRQQRTRTEARIEEARSADLAAAAEVMSSDATPIRPERVMAEIDRQLAAEDIVCADASYATIWVGAYLTSRSPGQRFITPRGLAGLGWGAPLALGAQAAHPESRVVCVTGDGGFGHSWSELETAVRERLPVTFVVLNNSILGFQKHFEVKTWGDHTSAVHFGEVDHAAVARACGMAGVRVTDPSAIEAELRSALQSADPTLIEVIIDDEAHPPINGWD